MSPFRLMTIVASSFLCFVAVPAMAESCFLLLSCAPDKLFHPVKCKGDRCTTEAGGDPVPLVSMFVENHGWAVYPTNIYPKLLLPTDYYRGWLEFNDDGRAFDNFHKLAILGKIGELKKKGTSILIVVYIHGWHNNADNSNPTIVNNAVKFDYFMARQVDEVRRLFEQRGEITTPAVLGVYVGWRGDSITTPKLSTMTIANRAAAADRLALNRGADDLYQSLKAIAEAMHEADPDGRMLVIGHSLGGRIVTRLFLDDIAKGDFQPLGKNSLLVAMEPAVGADCYDKVLGGSHNGRTGTPTFISLASEDDDAVRKIYRTGSFLLSIPDCDSSSPSHGRAIGDYDAYLSHRLTYNDYHDGSLPAARFSETFPVTDSKLNWFSSLGDKPIIYRMRDIHCREKDISACYVGDSQFYTMHFTQLDNIHRDGPVWSIRTDKSVIDIPSGDHAAVDALHNGYISTNFTRALIEMLYAHNP